MRFRMKCANDRNPMGWWEEYQENDLDTLGDAQAWAELTTEEFNRTLRSGELPRQVLEVEVLDPDAIDHEYEKVNNFTLTDGRGGLYDLYKCKNCSVTARRYGLESIPVRESKYRAKVYARCDTALAHLEKKQQKKP